MSLGSVLTGRRSWHIQQGDALDILRTMPDESVQCVVTSPPYWGLRDYGVDGALGMESTVTEYVANIVQVFQELHRVLRGDGTLWLNLGDSYVASPNAGTGWESSTLTQPNGRARKIQKAQEAAMLGHRRFEGLAPKNLIGIPWRVVFALQDQGWWLRSDIIWSKPNAMPESVTDRLTRVHEYVFLLTRSARYFYDAGAIRVNGANKRTVWAIPTEPFPEAHFATFPKALVEPCVKAGSRPDDIVLDPFAGSGTTGLVALRLNRRFIGVELNTEYCGMARRRIEEDAPLFNRIEA